MLKNSFSERMNSAKVMLASILANPDLLAHRGVTKEFIDKMAKLFDEIQSLDNQHEAMKGNLRAMTADLWSKMDDLDQMFRETKKLVKMEVPKEQWIAYGFTSQR